MESAPVYHIKGWGKFNRNYGDFCTGADNRRSLDIHIWLATTLDIYTHASGSAQRDAVNLLEGQLFPNVPKLETCGNIAETESQLVQ